MTKPVVFRVRLPYPRFDLRPTDRVVWNPALSARPTLNRPLDTGMVLSAWMDGLLEPDEEAPAPTEFAAAVGCPVPPDFLRRLRARPRPRRSRHLSLVR